MEVAQWFEEAGADWISFHIETTPHAHKLINTIKGRGKKAGITLNPSTPLELIYPVIEEVDFVLLMAVNPGFEGQKFIPSTLKRIDQLRRYIENLKGSPEIQVDGGIGPYNLRDVLSAGATLIVAGSSIFKSNDPISTYRLMKKIEEEFREK